VEKLCIKCGYQRKSGDTAPETKCLHCGAPLNGTLGV